MSGGLIQLVAHGIENLYLTEDPQITFFKIVYRRHTNFSIESIPQYFNIKANFSNRVSCSISKNGDLINKIYVVVTLPNIPTLQNGAKVKWVENIGYVLLKTVELEIGGKIIDTHYGDWLYIWNELNKNNNIRGINNMIGNIPELINYSSSKDEYMLYIPLQFWFCRNVSLSLPIIALEYSEVKINVEFSDIINCIIAGPTHYIYIYDTICLFESYELIQIDSSDSYIQFVNFDQTTMRMGYIKTDPAIVLSANMVLTGINSKYVSTVYDPSTNLFPTILTNNEVLNFSKSNTTFRNIFNLTLSDAFLYVDYVYLDNIERIKFAKSNHEYLIDVCQFDNDKIIFNSNNKIKVGYSHPTKELIIIAQFDHMINDFYKDTFNYTTNINPIISKSLIKKILIKLNGFNREPDYDKNFYSYIQAYQHHKSTPPNGVFLYSFALYPCDTQPSGSCNFSRIDDLSIDITVEPISYNKPAKIKIYAISYNILRIINGVAGLAFEN
jgi:hypothetical protein